MTKYVLPAIGDSINVRHTTHFDGAPRAAIVTGIRKSGDAPTAISATVFQADGTTSPVELSMHLRDWQAAGSDPAHAYWHWPTTERV